VFAFLKSLFFPSVADVIGSIQRKVDQLERIEDRKAVEADEIGDEIVRLKVLRADCLIEREYARNVYRKLAALISIGDAQ
jgi:hypothetical protein